MVKTLLETLRVPAGRVSMGIPMFSHAMIYEKVAVCQCVVLISVVLRLRPNRLATQRVLGTWGFPRLTHSVQ